MSLPAGTISSVADGVSIGCRPRELWLIAVSLLRWTNESRAKLLSDSELSRSFFDCSCLLSSILLRSSNVDKGLPSDTCLNN